MKYIFVTAFFIYNLFSHTYSLINQHLILINQKHL
jgi:hypothetical protein